MNALRIVVLGGGITGLSAAYRCKELAAERGIPVAVTLLERSSRVGGCIETRHDDGFVLEMGPDSLVAEKPAAIELARRLGLGDRFEPIREEYRGARIVRHGRLVPIPDTFRFFTPTSLGSLLSSRLLSFKGIARAAMEPFIPPRSAAADESLGSFVTRRFGREVLDRLAQPLIGGIYSGDPERLSMQATLPQFLQLERKYGSLVRGMRAASKRAGGAKPGHRMMSLRAGLGSLVAALERELHEEIRTGSDVEALTRVGKPDGGSVWHISLADGTQLVADAVICALPAYAAARLLAPVETELARMLQGIRYHSVATITMAYAASEIPKLPRCTGFVVPQIEGRKVMAVTFSSQKYEHRSPDGTTILRAFAGGALQSSMMTMTDAELVKMVRSEFRELLGITSEARFSIVRRWHDALPEYALEHTRLADEIECAVSQLDGLALAGSAYRGVGIADCVRSGETAASKMFSAISASERPSRPVCS